MGTFFFGLVLLSHTLFFGYLASTRSGVFFYGALSAVNSRGGGATGPLEILAEQTTAGPSGVRVQAARPLGQAAVVGECRYAGADREGHPHLLARRDPMGPVADPAWPVDRLHREPPPFFAPAD